MNKNQLRQEEHQRFFFGICSSEVHYTLEESIKRCIRDFLEQIEETLIEENVCTKEEIEKEVSELKALYISRCLKVLADFKNVLRDIFEIPENAPIYPEPKKKTYTVDELNVLREKVADLDQKFVREKKFLVHLKSEKELLEKLRPSLVDTKMILDLLKNKTDSEKLDKLKKIHQKREEVLKNLDPDVKFHQFSELTKDLGI